MGELHCRVCGLLQAQPIWGEDGNTPTYDVCPCCGCDFGCSDDLPEAILRHRQHWLAEGAAWREPRMKPGSWKLEDQLRALPAFYFRLLPGLPGTGPAPVQFSERGRSTHSEGTVVEFTTAAGAKWVGNFQPGMYGTTAVLRAPGSQDRAMVIAKGEGYIVEPQRRALVGTFGGDIIDVFSIPDRDALIFGNGLRFECYGEGRLRWKTKRISWDGMMHAALEGDHLRGEAFDPMTDGWLKFSVDLETGETIGGSYPPELR
jgi:hypothetical protein